MNNYLKSNDNSACCGCSACAAVCPRSCIKLLKNDEGFFYPECNVINCVDCGLCSKVCPIENQNKNNGHIACYALINNDQDVLYKSSSGGVFYELAKKMIESGGIVFGASLGADRELTHKYVDTIDNLGVLLGSKYIQSDVAGSFPVVKNFLDIGKKVLFVGTPCQVSGLKLFLRRHYDNLYTIDLLCHGVPSNKIFKAYVGFLEHKHKGKLISINFRSKTRNGWSITLSYDILRGAKVKQYNVTAGLSPYFFAFLRGKILRESCYCCPFATEDRVGDITLADFWGIEKVRPDLNTSLGCSSVIINTIKGQNMVNDVLDSFLAIPVSFEEASVQNINFFESPKRHIDRETIYNDLNNKGFNYVSQKYCKNPRRWRIRIKNLLTSIKKLYFNS